MKWLAQHEVRMDALDTTTHSCLLIIIAKANGSFFLGA